MIEARSTGVGAALLALSGLLLLAGGCRSEAAPRLEAGAGQCLLTMDVEGMH